MKLFEGFTLTGKEVEWESPEEVGWGFPGRWMHTGKDVTASYSEETQWIGGEGGLVMVTVRAIDSWGRRLFKAGDGPSWLGPQFSTRRGDVFQLVDQWLWEASWPEGVAGWRPLLGTSLDIPTDYRPSGIGGQSGGVQVSEGRFKSKFGTYLDGLGFGWYVPRREVAGHWEMGTLVSQQIVVAELRVFLDGVRV